MEIWADICHTPHVLLLAPIMRELEKRGHSVLITARNAFQTCELLDLHGLQYQVIGQHYGEKKIFKLYGIFARSLQLWRYAQTHNFKLSLSIGSPYQAIASFLSGIPFVIINDYEHSSIFNIIRYIAHRLFFPVYISDTILKSRGIALEKVIKFPGLKEDIYLEDFTPNQSVLQLLNIDIDNHILVLLRPPASEAHYHNPKSDQLMHQILEYLKDKPDLIVVVIPRGEKQRKEFQDLSSNGFGKNFKIPAKAIDTLSLLYYSDVMIGGGGTMNREAAALGVPTYSYFCGPIGEVDRFLQKAGKLFFITSGKDILTIQLTKKNKTAQKDQQKNELKSFVIQQILSSIQAE